MLDFVSSKKVGEILQNLDVKKEAVSPGTTDLFKYGLDLLMLTWCPEKCDDILEPSPVKIYEVKKREKMMKPQTPEEKHRIFEELKILHAQWHQDAAMWGAEKNAVMMWSYKPLQSCCDGNKPPTKICSASAKIWDKKQPALPPVHSSTNPSTEKPLSHEEFMKPIMVEWEKKSNLIQFSAPSSPVSSESSGYRSQSVTPDPSSTKNSTPTVSGKNSPLAVAFASPPNAGLLQQRLQDHEGCQEIEGRVLEVLKDPEFGCGNFGRLNLGSPEQHDQGRLSLQDNEGNPFMKVLAHGGRQDLEGPQDYEPRALISGCDPRPFALQLPLFGGLDGRSRHALELSKVHEGYLDEQEQQGFQPLLALAKSTQHDQTKVNILRLLELANSNEDLANPLNYEDPQVHEGRQAHWYRQAHVGLQDHKAHPYWNNPSEGHRYQGGRQHGQGFQPLIVPGDQVHESRQDLNGCEAAGWGFQPLKVPGAQSKEKTPEQPKAEPALTQQERFWSNYYKNLSKRKGSGRFLRDPNIGTLEY